MEEMIGIIEDNQVPAPAPIEQRWSASSRADMSPAGSPDNLDAIYCWVGIIMYLPESDPEQRALIKQR